MPVPVPRRPYAYSSLDRVNRLAVEETYRTASFMLTEGVARGVAEAGARVCASLGQFVAALDQTTRSSRSQLTNVHEQLARGMQEATLARYEAARAGGRMSGPYRLSKRDAGGRLGRAIASAGFVRGTYDGIGFANNTLLDTEARQWHRLNFGAGSAAGPRPRRFQASIGGTVIAALGLEDTPSAPFVLPAGVWTTVGGGERQRAGAGLGWFFPQSERPAGILGRPNRARITRGIRAWNFLDAGIEFLAENLGPAYEGLYRDWWESAQRGVGPFSRVDTINIPRLARSRTSYL